MSQLVNKFECRGLIAPGKSTALRHLLAQVAALEAFHQESHPAGGRDRIDAVVIAVPVGFHDKLGVPDSQIRAETGGCFVFRTVHPDFLAGVAAAFQGNPSALGALQVAARETAVIAAMIEQMLRVIFAADLGCARVRSSLEIAHRQRLVFGFTHEGDQSGAPLAMHLQRLRIHFPDHFVQFGAGSLHSLPIRRTIGILSVRIVGQHDDGLNLLVAHHGADSRASGLFYPEKSLLASTGLVTS